MYRPHRLLLPVFLCFSMTSASSLAQNINTQRVLWNKRAIPLGLSINQERIIHFPTDVRYWVPDSIQPALSMLSVNGVLYITALAEFDKTRIRVQSLTTQKIYLLDLSSSQDDGVVDEVIIMDKDFIENKSPTKKTETWQGDWFIRLTRFASQSLYAPLRLIPADDEIHRLRVDSQTPVPLVRGAMVEAIPIASWRGGEFFLTAVRIKNITSGSIGITHEQSKNTMTYDRSLVLSDDLRGDWIASTPQHTKLDEFGPSSVTTLYMLSHHTFVESF